jgi:hypothetical protein
MTFGGAGDPRLRPGLKRRAGVGAPPTGGAAFINNFGATAP